jgi:hypothetical protein
MPRLAGRHRQPGQLVGIAHNVDAGDQAAGRFKRHDVPRAVLFSRNETRQSVDPCRMNFR